MKRTHLLRHAVDADLSSVYKVANRRVVDMTAARVAWASEKAPRSASVR